MARSSTTLVPTAGLEVAPFGILSPATTTYDHSDSFWTSGFTYENKDAGIVVVNGPIYGGGSEDITVVDNSGATELFKTYYPFDIKGSVKVSTMGTSPADIEEAVKTALDIVKQKAVEFEFYEGQVAQTLTVTNDNRYLASAQTTDVTPTPGTAVKVRYGLGILEQSLGLGSIGSKGTIHVTRDVATALRLDKDGKKLVTPLGTPLVSGVGYTKVGPDGSTAAEGTAWMYATGPVSVRLGQTIITPEKLNQAIDIRINNVQYYADRAAAVTWATNESYAVLVDLTLDYS